METRFWARVDRSGGPDACWPWLGALDASGYGRVFVLGSGCGALVHRVSFQLAGGGEPEAVCHRCDNPPCVNPAHLFAGTRAINNADMARKGRASRANGKKGEAHRAAKLTNDDVKRIREVNATGALKQRDIARMFGVCQRTVGRILLGVGWTHV